jgi:hypothetical protein
MALMINNLQQSFAGSDQFMQFKRIVSSTALILPSLALAKFVNQPFSSVKPMFIKCLTVSPITGFSWTFCTMTGISFSISMKLKPSSSGFAAHALGVVGVVDVVDDGGADAVTVVVVVVVDADGADVLAFSSNFGYRWLASSVMVDVVVLVELV